MPEVLSPEDAELIVQKAPCDMGIHRTGRKGTLEAPSRLMEDFEPGLPYMVTEVFPHEFDLGETQSRIRDSTVEMLESGKPLLTVGGDHSISYPVLSALKEDIPGLQLVWLDAHLDMKERVDRHVSHDVVVRELLDYGFTEQEIRVVGVTERDEDEMEFLEEHDGITFFGPDELEEFLREFESDEQPVYLSVDVDVLDGRLAPGTGYPDGELELEDVKAVIGAVKPDHADLVEVAPPLDREDRTVENGAEILETLTTVLKSGHSR